MTAKPTPPQVLTPEASNSSAINTPAPLSLEHANYQRITQAIQFLVEQQTSQPNLKQLASHVGISEYHLQRTFQEWAGVSPKQFLQYLTKQHAKQQLRQQPVLASSLAVGLSGSGRLHDLFVNCEGVTPGEYRSAGEGLEILYGVHHSPFGYCFIAQTQRGVCKLSFFDQADDDNALTELQQEWPNASVHQNSETTHATFMRLFPSENSDAHLAVATTPLKLLLKGSPFQLQVWEALLTVPSGSMRSYQHIADTMGKPSAVRAVASAIARNPLAYLIPCHRVIRSTGALNNYRWGDTRKAAMLGWEQALTNMQAPE
jgi:AraC family transcriptional regulator of adaptative response/methylated-DNA-[protein]-cysteine methyltransferase